MKNKNAIVGLVRGHANPKAYHMLRRRNRLLMENYYKHNKDADVIIFHEGNIKKEHQEELKKDIPIKFHNVGNLFKAQGSNKTNLGYKHMCRFYAMQMAPILDKWGYEKYWRLDDDSFILKKIEYNVFKFMENNQTVYGYIHTKIPVAPQAKLTERTLLPLVKKHMKEEDIKTKWGKINGRNHYSNFHISQVKFWMKPEVRKFLDCIDKGQGIYAHRWGDHIIQTLTLKLFATEKQMKRMPWIHYNHGSHNFEVIS